MPFETRKLRKELNPIAHVNIKFSEEETKMIDDARLNLGLNRSDFVRFCIGKYLNNK